MPVRHLPVRPDLDQLKHQAKDLLDGARHQRAVGPQGGELVEEPVHFCLHHACTL